MEDFLIIILLVVVIALTIFDLSYFLYHFFRNILSNAKEFFIRNSFFIFFFILILSLNTIEVFEADEERNLNPFDYARITDVSYKAIVQDEPNNGGTLLVTERMTFDVHAADIDNPFWELWRALPEKKVDGVYVDYDVKSVKQILDDGSEIIYDESDKLYWDDNDYIDSARGYGPGKWYHSKGPYDEYRHQYECVMFYVDGIYRDHVTFEVEYEMNNASLRYLDCSSLYLTFYSEDTIKYLDSYKGEILVANKDMPKEGNYSVSTFGTRKEKFEVTESDTLNPGYHTFSFNLDKSDLKFAPYNQYIELTLLSSGDDRHSFTDYAPHNTYSNDYALEEILEEQKDYYDKFENSKSIKSLILGISIFLGIHIIYSATNIKKKIINKYSIPSPTQEYEYFREIPNDLDPLFVAEMVLGPKRSIIRNPDGLATTLLSLVRKKYLAIEKIDETQEWKESNIKIRFLHEENDDDKEQLLVPLTLTEKVYFKLLKRPALTNNKNPKLAFNERSLVGLRKYFSDKPVMAIFYREIEDTAYKIGASNNYFSDIVGKNQVDKSQIYLTGINDLLDKFYHRLTIAICLLFVNLITYMTRLDLAFGAFILLSLSFTISSIYLRKDLHKYFLLTPLGADEITKWRGLYNFLNSETLMNERTHIELPLWEQYLVYATAFGISKKVTKVFQSTAPEYFKETNSFVNCSYINSRRFHHYSRSFSRSSSSHYYSGGIYGGGYSGGRGGRRRRWRSLKLNENKQKTYTTFSDV